MYIVWISSPHAESNARFSKCACRIAVLSAPAFDIDAPAVPLSLSLSLSCARARRQKGGRSHEIIKFLLRPRAWITKRSAARRATGGIKLSVIGAGVIDGRSGEQDYDLIDRRVNNGHARVYHPIILCTDLCAD